MFEPESTDGDIESCNISRANQLLFDRFQPSSHGGNKQEMARLLNIPVDQILDFSASVNPLGPSPGTRAVLGCLESILAEYPDPDSILFCEKVSEYLQIPLRQILVTNGSVELIHLLPNLVGSGKEVIILRPFFSEYERAFRFNKIHTHSENYDVEGMFRMDIERLLNYLRGHPQIEMMVLGNPNNPTGHLWDEESLELLVQFCKSRNIFLVVDETFVEFCEKTVSVLKWVDSNPYLIVVRSMTKFYGLAGVRLGYGVMHPELRTKLKDYQIPWSVNSIAQKLGVVALDDHKYFARIKLMMLEQRERLFLELSSISGIKVFPSHANFLLFKLLTDNTREASQFYKGMLESGILVRSCSNFDGLDKSYFRVAVRTAKENRILVSKIKNQLGKEC